MYGCSESEFTPPPWCYFTQNGKRLYLHLAAWPFSEVHFDGLAGRVAYAQLLNNASGIKRRGPHERLVDEETLMLKLPVRKPEVVVPVVELFLR